MGHVVMISRSEISRRGCWCKFTNQHLAVALMTIILLQAWITILVSDQLHSSPNQSAVAPRPNRQHALNEIEPPPLSPLLSKPASSHQDVAKERASPNASDAQPAAGHHAGKSSHTTPDIPRILHFVWLSSPTSSQTSNSSVAAVPQHHLDNIQTWRAANPAWTTRLWTVDAISRQLPGLVPYLNPARAPDRNPANRLQRISDLVRFKILFEFGGICIEPDIRALNKSLDELISVVQEDGGAAFSVCREVNQFHPDKTQRPTEPPPGVFHGENDFLSKKCHRVDSAVIGAPQRDGAIKQASETAITSMDAARSDDEFDSRARDMTIAWTRILRERRERNEDAHWRILASRAFFGIGCTRNSSSSRGECESAESHLLPKHVYATHHFDVSAVPSLLAFSREIPHTSGARTKSKSSVRRHPRCFPLNETRQFYSKLNALTEDRDRKAAYRFNISVMYHDEASHQKAKVFEACPWATFRLMEQSVYFESMAVLSASSERLAAGQYSFVGFLPYSILRKQAFKFTPGLVALDALVECSVVWGSRRNASEHLQTQALSGANGTRS